jgi:hypothetical protein
MNPFRQKIPKSPKVTIRDIVRWMAGRPPVTARVVSRQFRITPNDAGVRLRKLHRWGYCTRRKPEEPPRVYYYRLSKFGETAARRWSR